MLEPSDLLDIYVLGALVMVGVVVYVSYRVEGSMEKLGIEDQPGLWRRLASNLVLVAMVVLWPLTFIALPPIVGHLYKKINEDEE